MDRDYGLKDTSDWTMVTKEVRNEGKAYKMARKNGDCKQVEINYGESTKQVGIRDWSLSSNPNLNRSENERKERG